MSKTLSGINEDLSGYPDDSGHFGIYGGRFVSEILMAALQDLEETYTRLTKDNDFVKEFIAAQQNHLINAVGGD